MPPNDSVRAVAPQIAVLQDKRGVYIAVYVNAQGGYIGVPYQASTPQQAVDALIASKQ